VRKCVWLILLVAGCGAGSDFGVSEENPLGTLDAIEAHLSAEGLSKQKTETLGSGRKEILYLDTPATMRFTHMAQFVAVTVDPEGNVVKLVGLASNDRSGDRTGIERFLRAYWEKIAGGPPVLTKDPEDESTLRIGRAAVSTDTVEGKWSASVFSETSKHTDHDVELKRK
jgi:hypothetical protein